MIPLKKQNKYKVAETICYCVNGLLDRPSLVMVARSYKKSFTELAQKTRYQKTLPLSTQLGFHQWNFASNTETSPLTMEVRPYVRNSASATKLCLQILCIKHIHIWLFMNIQTPPPTNSFASDLQTPRCTSTLCFAPPYFASKS
jgi:hypothetical protein